MTDVCHGNIYFSYMFFVSQFFVLSVPCLSFPCHCTAQHVQSTECPQCPPSSTAGHPPQRTGRLDGVTHQCTCLSSINVYVWYIWHVKSLHTLACTMGATIDWRVTMCIWVFMSAALVIECNIFTIFTFLPAMHTSVVQLFYMAHIFISFAFSYVFKHNILIASGNSVHRNDWLSIEIWAKKLWGRERFKMLVAEGATSAGVHLGGQQIICEASKLIRFVDTWLQKTEKKSSRISADHS